MRASAATATTLLALLGAAVGAQPALRAVEFAPRGDEGIRLEGMLHLPEHEPGEAVAGFVMCHPDPSMGGTANDAVVMAVAGEAVRRGAAVLRFNFRGVGDSTGEFDDGEGEVKDALGALDFLRGQPEIDPARTCLAGYSFGAAMALLAALEDESVAAYAGVSLPYSGLAHERKQLGSAAKLTQRAIVVIGDEDAYGDAEAIEELLPADTTQVVRLEGVGHFYRAIGALETMAKAIVGFLLEIEAELGDRG